MYLSLYRLPLLIRWTQLTDLKLNPNHEPKLNPLTVADNWAVYVVSPHYTQTPCV